MENATKALMIAGAVLLAIMLISVGLMIYNGALGGINDSISQMSQTEKDQFNNQFRVYEGKKKGSDVKELISKVITHNNQMVEVETPVKAIQVVKGSSVKEITNNIKAEDINGTGAGAPNAKTTKLEEVRREIVSGKFYTVKVYTGKTGLVYGITVQDSTSGSASNTTT